MKSCQYLFIESMNEMQTTHTKKTKAKNIGQLWIKYGLQIIPSNSYLHLYQIYIYIYVTNFKKLALEISGNIIRFYQK